MIPEEEYLKLKVEMLQERIMRLEAQSLLGQQLYDTSKKELEEVTERLRGMPVK